MAHYSALVARYYRPRFENVDVSSHPNIIRCRACVFSPIDPDIINADFMRTRINGETHMNRKPFVTSDPSAYKT